MTFEEAMKHFKDGTATPEEREYIKRQLSLADEALNGKSKPAIEFEQALSHVQDGTATEEERQFIQEQMLVAKEVMDSRTEMNFEEAMKHVQDGTATEEEDEFVKAELKDINRIFSDIERRRATPIPEASREQVKQAKKSFKWRYIVVPMCVILIGIIAIGAVLGGVFGFAASSAKSAMKYDKNACINIARQYTADNFENLFHSVPAEGGMANYMKVEEMDKHFRYNGMQLGKSYYVFEIELEGKTLIATSHSVKSVELTVKYEIDTRNGSVRLLECDIDD